MSRLFTALAVLCLVSGCGQVASPTSPAGNSFSETTLYRIVSDVGGGNSENCPTCAGIRGVITLDSPMGTVSTAYPGTSRLETFQIIGKPFEFFMHPGLLGSPLMTVTGRLAEYELRYFSFYVTPEKASLRMVMNSPPPEFAFLMADSSVPSFDIVNDASCSSGQRLETSVVFHVEHLGRTELRDVHCIVT